jgi:cell division protein FtsW (lipid II flippase)
MPKLEPYNKLSKGFDVRLIIYYLALVVIGWITIYSTCYIPDGSTPFFDFGQPYGKQMLWIGTSFFLATVILLIDSGIIQHYAYFFYLFCLFLMILVLFIGAEINGAKSWIKIGSFSIQPTEFMKVATALALAKFMQEGKTESQRRNVWIVQFALIFIPVIVALLQHDAGSALVFFSFIILFYREGFSAEFLVLGIIAAILAFITLKFNETYSLALITAVFIGFMIANRTKKKKMRRNVIVYVACIVFVFSVNFLYEHGFEPHQKQRIDTILGKTSDPLGADFNLNHVNIGLSKKFLAHFERLANKYEGVINMSLTEMKEEKFIEKIIRQLHAKISAKGRKTDAFLDDDEIDQLFFLPGSLVEFFKQNRKFRELFDDIFFLNAEIAKKEKEISNMKKEALEQFKQANQTNKKNSVETEMAFAALFGNGISI